MNKQSLEGKKIAILVADGFEEVEFTKPKQALAEAGASCDVVSINEEEVKAWDMDDWGATYTVHQHVRNARADDYDGLLLPGGVMNPDYLRMDENAVRFVRSFFEQSKPVAAICHGPWTLIDAGVVDGRMLTSYPSLKTDLKNAGANWVDREVVVDEGLVTSRNPDDLPAFCDKMVEEFAEGIHAGQVA